MMLSRLWFSALVAVLFVGKSYAQPFIALNPQLPVMEGLGFSSMKSAVLLSAGEWRFSLAYDLKSYASDAGTQQETLILDGETQDISINAVYGLSTRWQLDLELRHLKHSGGVLDSAIDQWHDWFGLSEGDRAGFAQDDILFRYLSDDKNSEINRSVSGFGDTHLGITYALNDHQGDKVDLSIRLGMSLPTGDEDKLIGSDKLDWNVGLTLSDHIVLGVPMRWDAFIGVVLPGDDSMFGIPVNDHVWRAGASIHWQATRQWGIGAQINWHEAVFESAIPELNRSTTTVAFAVDYRFDAYPDAEPMLQLAIGEDISVNQAADFAVGLRASWRYY